MFRSLFLFLLQSFKTNTQLKLEILFLRKQLEIYQRTNHKLKIRGTDRMFFSLPKGIVQNWKDKLFIVKPDTVIKWHRLGFRYFWRRKSGEEGGRPQMNIEVIKLIRQMAFENPNCGAPRIHGELLKLGFRISESTVKRYMPKKGARGRAQSWKTFLKNHSKEIISIDFLTIPTINFKQIYVLVIKEHH